MTDWTPVCGDGGNVGGSSLTLIGIMPSDILQMRRVIRYFGAKVVRDYGAADFF